MRRRFTNRQRLTIKKYSLLTLSVLIILTIFFSIPEIARALPESLAVVLTEKADTSDSSGTINTGERLTPLLGVSFSAVLGYDYESEPIIPPLEGIEGAEYVRAVNLCWYTTQDTPKLNLINRTDYKVNLYDYTDLRFPIENKVNSDPLVLIVHTHGTESYLPSGVDYYTAEETFRSEEQAKTVVAVGAVLAAELNSKGIVTLHDTEMHDRVSYSASYGNSKKAVSEALAKYPSIKYVIDLHRDAVFTSDGVNQKPITEINGQQVAQIMLVIGTNQGGANHPDWKNNLTVGVKLQGILNNDYPTLARPIQLRTASFNQQLATGSLLLEVGSCGNTIDEAKNAAKLFAASFAKMIYSN
ncbi:MAG: hypothetical protein CVU97_03020 [Firmicutes bacterium HGW-Firmicutes-21]|nr:MAG: hypothetical protein CVU97_03020 [Firmicutes bacterium HGW-Firmicutes-21]